MGGPDLEILPADHRSTTFPSAFSAAAFLGQADCELSCEVRVYMFIQHTSSASFAVLCVAFCDCWRAFAMPAFGNSCSVFCYFLVLLCLSALDVGVLLFSILPSACVCCVRFMYA